MATSNIVEIVDSGTIGVVKVANDGKDEEEDEANFYNTNNELYRKKLSYIDSITVNL